MEIGKILFQSRQLFGKSQVFKNRQPFFLCHAEIFISVAVFDFARCFNNVLAPVSVLRHFCILPKQLEANGFKKTEITFKDKAVLEIIRRFEGGQIAAADGLRDFEDLTNGINAEQGAHAELGMDENAFSILRIIEAIVPDIDHATLQSAAMAIGASISTS